jgi:hypothetical protein
MAFSHRLLRQMLYIQGQTTSSPAPDLFSFAKVSGSPHKVLEAVLGSDNPLRSLGQLVQHCVTSHSRERELTRRGHADVIYVATVVLGSNDDAISFMTSQWGDADGAPSQAYWRERIHEGVLRSYWVGRALCEVPGNPDDTGAFRIADFRNWARGVRDSTSLLPGQVTGYLTFVVALIEEGLRAESTTSRPEWVQTGLGDMAGLMKLIAERNRWSPGYWPVRVGEDLVSDVYHAAYEYDLAPVAEQTTGGQKLLTVLERHLAPPDLAAFKQKWNLFWTQLAQLTARRPPRWPKLLSQCVVGRNKSKSACTVARFWRMQKGILLAVVLGIFDTGPAQYDPERLIFSARLVGTTPERFFDLLVHFPSPSNQRKHLFSLMRSHHILAELARTTSLNNSRPDSELIPSELSKVFTPSEVVFLKSAVFLARVTVANTPPGG